jgi:hypothetical protein
MFEELEDYRFSQRRAKRVAHAKPLFAVLYSPDSGPSWIPAYGTDLALGRFKLLSRNPVPGCPVPVRLSLGACSVSIWARRARDDEAPLEGVPVQGYGMEILALGGAGREAITQWLNHEQAMAVVESPGGAAVPIGPADVGRLIPADFRRRVASALMRAGRLAPDSSGHYFALRYEYAGVTIEANGPRHHFIVGSRVVRGNQVHAYTTNIGVDELGLKLTLESAAAAAS